MPLSQMTIASLRDIGWNVNYGAAESYSSQDTQFLSMDTTDAFSALVYDDLDSTYFQLT